MLLLAVVALIMPARVRARAGRRACRGPTRRPSTTTPTSRSCRSASRSCCCSRTWRASLFSLRTHKDLFNPTHGAEDHVGEPWTVRRSVIMLAIAGVAVGVMSEILVGSISEASESIGLSPFFVGVIVVAIVGNAAEHWVAIYFASRDKMDLAVNIAIGSSAQIALFAAPVLVLLSLVRRRLPDGARLQRLRARRGRARGADRPAGRRRRASRPGSRASSCSRSTSSSALTFFFV